jgi:hypothetical protein
VWGSIAHHAIEMLLKSCLAKDDSGDKIAIDAAFSHAREASENKKESRKTTNA